MCAPRSGGGMRRDEADIIDKRPAGAAPVPRVGTFDLDHVGPKVTQELHAYRALKDMAKVNDANSVECCPSLVHRVIPHPLRAYDTVQLASALRAQSDLGTIGGPPIVFVAADDQLVAAARAEGLQTDNPNHHP